jgi:hypothetical protein
MLTTFCSGCLFLTLIFRLLLHTETSDGSVIPVWEEVQSADVAVLKDIMATRHVAGKDVELVYSRIPITAERPPDPPDLMDLLDVVARTQSSNTPIVVNCQLGRGRSTLASVSYGPSRILGVRSRHCMTDHTVVGSAVVRAQ